MTLQSFLQDIAINPKTLASWKRDKEATMTAAGLSDSDKEALRSGDPAEIRAALGDSVVSEINIILIFWWSFSWNDASEISRRVPKFPDEQQP